MPKIKDNMKNKTILVFLAVFLIISVSALSVDNNTVALWNLDEGSGISIIDSTGNGNDGTITGGATWTTDSVSGYALEFDGVNDYVPITKTSSLDVSNEMTLEASVKRKSNTNGMVFSRNGPYYLAVRNNVISGGVFAGSWWEEVSGVTTLEQNVWYNLKLTYDGQNLNLYVNDVLDVSVPKTGLIGPWSQRGYIGYGEPGQNQYFTGIIDEVRISNIARTNSSEPPEPPQPTLEERVGLLEGWKNSIIQEISNIWLAITGLTTRVETLENKTEENLSKYANYMSFAERKTMLCGYAKANNLTSIQDLGLICKLNCKRTAYCNCIEA